MGLARCRVRRPPARSSPQRPTPSWSAGGSPAKSSWRAWISRLPGSPGRPFPRLAALRVAGAAGYDDGLRDAFLDARHLQLFDGTDAGDIDAIANDLLGER